MLAPAARLWNPLVRSIGVGKKEFKIKRFVD